MIKMRFANKMAAIASGILSFAGAVLAVILLINSIKGAFDWYRFIPAVLYLLCFFTLAVYAFTKGIKSKYAFQGVVAAYGLVVLMTGLVFPPVYPQRFKLIFIAMPVIILLGLVGFNFFWKHVKVSRLFLTVSFIFEMALALLSIYGNPMLMEGDIVEQLALFIRPVILGSVAVCYLTRMYEKINKEGFKA